MKEKKTLYKLSVVASFLFCLHFYQIDTKCFFYYFLISLTLIFIPFLWNRWLYQEFIEDAIRPISYSTFIFIGNIVYLFLCILFFITIIYGYKPDGYVAGVC
jgi:small-conductance mechanosensitive channel